MFPATTASPLEPNFLVICFLIFSRIACSDAPCATCSTWPATAPMKAIPIMRVASSGVGALRLATAKASMIKKLIFFSRMVFLNTGGNSAHTFSGVLDDCKIKVPPSTSPLSGLVCTNDL